MMQNPSDPVRHEILTWQDVDKLIDILLPQLRSVGPFSGMIMITRGGVIPGGMLAEALEFQHLLTAAADFRHACSSSDLASEMSAWAGIDRTSCAASFDSVANEAAIRASVQSFATSPRRMRTAAAIMAGSSMASVTSTPSALAFSDVTA